MTGGGLFQSGNGGRSWSAHNSEIPVGPMAVSSASGTLYIGGRGSIAQSSDGGKTWKTLEMKRQAPAQPQR